MRITFLLGTAYPLFGSIRATLTTASALAARGHVLKIVSVFRERTVPSYRFDPNVPVVSLIDTRSPTRRRLAPRPSPTLREQELLNTPSSIVPDDELARVGAYNRMTDRVVQQYLASSPADIVISAWPALHHYLAELSSESVVTVAHDHLLYEYYSAAARVGLRKAYAKLDGILAVAAAAANTYRKRFPELEKKIHYIPNAIDSLGIPESTGDAKMVIAAGRLIHQKRFDVLIEAFAPIARKHPDWKLRIYGTGPEREKLLGLIHELRLYEHVFLMGLASPMESEWVKGSIGVLTSEAESFGLVILEAMQAGLPVISTDCPVGPGELIDHGIDGLLVPLGDIAGITAALIRLIESPEQRRTMAGGARNKAARFSADHVATLHETLYSSLLRGKMRPRHVSGANRAGSSTRSPPSSRRNPSRDISRIRDHFAVTCTSRSATELDLVFESAEVVDELLLTRTGSGETLSIARSSFDGHDTRFRLALDNLPHVATGTWTLSVANRIPYLKFIDNRRLVEGYDASSGAAGALLPVSDKGRLKVHVIAEASRAQLTGVSWIGDVLSLAGVLLGDVWPDMQVLIAAARGSKRVVVPCASSDGRFSCRIDVASVVEPVVASQGGGAESWKLWLANGEEPARRVRIGKIVSDMRNPATAVIMPSMTLVGSTADAVRIRPCYSRTGLLTLEVNRVDELVSPETILKAGEAGRG